MENGKWKMENDGRRSGHRRLLLFSILHFPFFILHFLAGCSGSAALHMVPMGYTRMDARAPLVLPLCAANCWYWIDDDRQIRVAMSDSGAGRSLELSLVLDGLPAGAGRNYRVTRRTLRGTLSQGGEHTRFASIRGIAAVWIDGPDRIDGRFRISMKHERFNILLGWHGAQEVLLLGQFRAVRDRRRCEAVVASTEQDGMERTAVSTQPSGPDRVIRLPGTTQP
jgi:hypothetical protein